MKKIIPLNAIGGGNISPTITAHYHKAGYSDFYPDNKLVPHIAIMEMEMEEPKILTPVRTELAKELRRQGVENFANRELVPREDGVSNTITTILKDNLVQEPRISVHPLSHALEFNGEGSIYDISPTLRATDYKCPHVVYEPTRQDNIAYKQMPNGNIRAYNTSTPDKRDISELQITNPDNEAPTLTTAHEPKIITQFRIRKLTPRECFRLMDMDDADIDKIDEYRIKTTLKDGTVKDKPISKSAKYRLAGNSIVVSCLYHIFKSMFIDEKPPLPPKQLDLFDDLWQKN